MQLYAFETAVDDHIYIHHLLHPVGLKYPCTIAIHQSLARVY